jgi:hypothetical protein
MSRDRGGEHDPEKPSAPGWYPDPWSATGEGERYFDGEKWGSSERPLGRLTVVDLDEHRKQRGRRKKPATGASTSRWRLPPHLRPVALLIALVLLIWGVPKLFQHDSAEPRIVDEPNTSEARTTPPPSKEEAAQPLGSPARSPGGPGKYELANTQPEDPSAPVAFDPCRPLHYVVDSKGAPADGLALVQQAIAKVHSATGLRFMNDGATDEAPTNGRAGYQPQRYPDRWAPVLIAWEDETEFPDLAGYIAGSTAPQPVSVPGRPDRLVYVTGTVVLDRSDLSVAKMPDRAEAQATIMHELGHLVGLGHTSDRTQLMFSEAQPKVKDFGAGDLRGLAILGTQPCYPNV